jgi:uncharacterized protein YjiS (DUF1127 family)
MHAHTVPPARFQRLSYTGRARLQAERRQLVKALEQAHHDAYDDLGITWRTGQLNQEFPYVPATAGISAPHGRAA